MTTDDSGVGRPRRDRRLELQARDGGAPDDTVWIGSGQHARAYHDRADCRVLAGADPEPTRRSTAQRRWLAPCAVCVLDAADAGDQKDASDQGDESEPDPQPDGGPDPAPPGDPDGDSDGDGHAAHGPAPGDHGGRDARARGDDDDPSPPAGAPPERIDELATVDEQGFLRVVGPFAVERAGTRWVVVIPRDELDGPAAHLSTTVGEGAVLVADGTICGGGIVVDVWAPDGEGDQHLVVDQYAAGPDDPGTDAGGAGDATDPTASDAAPTGGDRR